MSLPAKSPAIFDSLIGCTKLVPLVFPDEGVTIYAKCEFMNPSGSIKDRFARCVVEEAERSGHLRRNSIILECSSGNTGVALAMIGAAKGYAVEIVLDAKASPERRMLIEQFGAKVTLFDGNKGYQSGIDLARLMAARNPRYFLPRQFENALNARDHEETTGTEILDAIGRPIDAFVAGYGTGGTLVGISRALRKCFPELKLYAMEPAEAALLQGECSCRHRIEGVADGFIPPLMQGLKLDGSIQIQSDEAFRMATRLSREVGLLVGTSSGANIAAALRVAERIGRDKTIVTVLPDRAERYFSTPLFAKEPSPSAVNPLLREDQPIMD